GRAMPAEKYSFDPSIGSRSFPVAISAAATAAQMIEETHTAVWIARRQRRTSNHAMTHQPNKSGIRKLSDKRRPALKRSGDFTSVAPATAMKAKQARPARRSDTGIETSRLGLTHNSPTHASRTTTRSRVTIERSRGNMTKEPRGKKAAHINMTPSIRP